MRRLVLAGIALLALSGLAACAKKVPGEPAGSAEEARAASVAQDEAGSPAAPASAEASAPPVVQSRKLIRTVDLGLEVKATEAAAREVQDLAGKLGGYVSEVNAQRDETLLYYSITLRIPVERLDEALAAIRKLAVSIDGEHQKVEDVTDRFVDLEARLRTLQATEGELQALLAESRQRQRGVEEIMAVYRELTNIRSQIEQIQGQRDALAKLSALSTINVRLRPTESARPVTGDPWQPGSTVRSSARALVTVLRGLGDFLIFAVIVLLPTGILVFLFLALLRKLFRRIWPRRKAPPAPEPPR